jgi:phospholipase/lecithinase/hemolysin
LTLTTPGYHVDPPPTLGSPAFPAYYQGRASNGPNWVDQLADGLGIARAQASLDGGGNYAYASARSGPGTNPRYPSPTYPPNPPIDVPRVGSQIQAFAASQGHFQPGALVALWVGANDFRDIKGPGDIVGIVDNIDRHIRDLSALGAGTIVVPNQVDLSLPPINRQPGGTPGPVIRAGVEFFNQELAARLRALQSDPAVKARLILVDMFTAMDKVFADPASFGFTNVTSPALTYDPVSGTFAEAPDDSGYFWYDSIHPTFGAQKVFADAALAALVPAPGSLSLLLPGLAAMAALLAGRGKVRAATAE